MNDQVSETLAILIRKYGTSLIGEPRRLEGLLRDMCGEHRREIFVVISAMKAQVAAELLTLSYGMPLEIHMARLKKRLVEDLAFADDAASWAVWTWINALGLNGAQTWTNQFGKIHIGNNDGLTSGNEGKKAEMPPAFSQNQPEINLENLTNEYPVLG